MFSQNQKRIISAGIQQILRDTGHPDLQGEIQFLLRVNCKRWSSSWSHGISPSKRRPSGKWADVRKNIPVRRLMVRRPRKDKA